MKICKLRSCMWGMIVRLTKRLLLAAGVVIIPSSAPARTTNAKNTNILHQSAHILQFFFQTKHLATHSKHFGTWTICWRRKDADRRRSEAAAFVEPTGSTGSDATPEELHSFENFLWKKKKKQKKNEFVSHKQAVPLSSAPTTFTFGDFWFSLWGLCSRRWRKGNFTPRPSGVFFKFIYFFKFFEGLAIYFICMSV